MRWPVDCSSLTVRYYFSDGITYFLEWILWSYEALFEKILQIVFSTISIEFFDKIIAESIKRFQKRFSGNQGLFQALYRDFSKHFTFPLFLLRRLSFIVTIYLGSVTKLMTTEGPLP